MATTAGSAAASHVSPALAPACRAGWNRRPEALALVAAQAAAPDAVYPESSKRLNPQHRA